MGHATSKYPAPSSPPRGEPPSRELERRQTTKEGSSSNSSAQNSRCSGQARKPTKAESKKRRSQRDFAREIAPNLFGAKASNRSSSSADVAIDDLCCTRQADYPEHDLNGDKVCTQCVGWVPLCINSQTESQVSGDQSRNKGGLTQCAGDRVCADECRDDDLPCDCSTSYELSSTRLDHLCVDFEQQQHKQQQHQQQVDADFSCSSEHRYNRASCCRFCCLNPPTAGANGIARGPRKVQDLLAQNEQGSFISFSQQQRRQHQRRQSLRDKGNCVDELGKCQRESFGEAKPQFLCCTYARQRSLEPESAIESDASSSDCCQQSEASANEKSNLQAAAHGNELENHDDDEASPGSKVEDKTSTTATSVKGSDTNSCSGKPQKTSSSDIDLERNNKLRAKGMGEEESEEQSPQNKTSELTSVVSIPPNDCRENKGWKNLSQRYGGQMPQQTKQASTLSWISKARQSCFCHVITSTIIYLFPIFTSFKHYSLPSDLITDLATGFTIAVLQIPQGMAYGLLANVEPIYGLYVSFVPVVVMSLMSKSRHVSYGTFAIISMLLASAIESIKLAIKQQATVDAQLAPSALEALTMTDNHKPLDDSQKLMRNLVVNQLQPIIDDRPVMITTANHSQQAYADVAALLNGAENVEFVLPSNIEILTCLCLVVGLIQVAMALARLGLLSLLFSDQLVSSFTAASAVHVMTSQLGAMFDQDLPKVPAGLFKLFRTWLALGTQLYGGGFNHYTGILSVSSIVFLMSIKEIVEPAMRRRFKTNACLPSELVLMIALIFSSWHWQFATNYDIMIVGPVPTGLPPSKAPRLDLVQYVIQDSITIAVVSFAMNLSLAQVYAKRYKYEMDPNAELLALGTSNIVGSFFQCFPCASSLSRSAVQSNLDAKSQICSLFSCAIVASILCYFAPVLHDLPRSTLSCIIIVALKGILMQIKDLKVNWRLSKLDALVWIVTFAAVLELGVTVGLLVGVLVSLIMIIFRLLTPNYSTLGNIPGTDIYEDKEAFAGCREVDGCKIFKFNSALCSLNKNIFKSKILESLDSELKTGTSQHASHFKGSPADFATGDSDIRYLIIDCSGIAFCDYSGVGSLVEIIDELKDRKIGVYLAACSLSIIKMIQKLNHHDILGESVYATVIDAVNHVISLGNQTSSIRSFNDSKCPDETRPQSVQSSGP